MPESWNSSGGSLISVEDLTQWVLVQDNIEGITLSGGEPFEQAGALVRLVDGVRSCRDLSIMCYTGHCLEHLQRLGTTDQKALLGRIDLLVDGPYVASLHDNLLWRASSNQRLSALTPRYRDLLDGLPPDRDQSAGLELVLKPDGTFEFAGVPHRRGFRNLFQVEMTARGISLRTTTQEATSNE